MGVFEKDKIDLLTKNILAQVKYFLEDADEFFPFGSVIDMNNILKPVSMYSEKEIPESQPLFDQLQAALKKGIENKDYLMAAIAMDVYINTTLENGSIEKRTAIQIKYYVNEQESTTFYLYRKKNNDYHFEYYEMN